MSALLQDALEQFCPRRRVRIVYTDNSCTMSSVGRNNGSATFRLHRMFRDAPGDVIEALVRLHFVPNHRTTRRRLSEVARRYISSHVSHIRSRPRRLFRRRRLEPRGVFVDLAALFSEMNRRYFGGRVRAAITWSRSLNRRQMGCCDEGASAAERVIVINRLLDDPEVPQEYLSFLVVHEMLHCVFPRHTEKGRTVRHPRELREFEKKLPFYEQAMAWEKEQVDRLYRRRKIGRQAQLLLPLVR